MKRASVNLKGLTYLFWLAPMLIVAGLTAGVVAGAWGVIPFLLIAVGLGIALAWLIWQSRGGFWQRRSTQAGTNVLVSTVSVVVILGLVNFLGVRYAQQIDLTENRIFSLAPQTEQLLQGLDQPVKLLIFSANPSPTDEQLLENYQRQSDRFQYEYIDPQANPVLAQQVGVQFPGEVYLELGTEEERTYRYVQAITPDQPLSEQSITNAIAQLNSTRQFKVYMTQGHGERSFQAGQGGLSEAIARLQDNNYIVEPLQLTEEGQIPEDADVVIVPGPKQPFLEAEVEALETFATRGEGLLLLLDPTTQPGLDGLLEDWGVTLRSNAIILDPDGAAVGLGPAAPLITQYSPHPITEQLSGMSYYPVAQPISLEEIADVEAVPFLLTGTSAQVQPIDENGEVQVDPNAPQQGSLAVGVALSRPVVDAPNEASGETSGEDATAENAAAEESEGETPETPEDENTDPSAEEEAIAESRLVVIGNSAFATDGLFSQVLNGDVFLNSVAWLNNQEGEVLAIRPKAATNRRILLTLPQQAGLAVVSLLIVPLLAVAIAVFLWLKRR